MKRTVLIVAGLLVSFCLGFLFKTFSTGNKPVNNNPIGKITGVGGIFFKCKEPKKIKEWYKAHLGLETNQYGARFEWPLGADTTKKGSLQWSPFSEKTKYFDPSAKEFMINYTVDNLTGLVEQLKKDNVTICDTIETYEYGKFIHIMDIEGNKIELYEPNYAYHSK